MGQTNPTAQSVVVPGITDFNHGTWAIALETSPLPVELLSFTAMPEENNRVRCDWVTASEINNDFFTVERSKDGVTFEALGIVDGSGTTSAVSEYYFYDHTTCLLYTSPSPRDRTRYRIPSSTCKNIKKQPLLRIHLLIIIIRTNF